MKQVTVHIPDKNYPFFLELVKRLGFVKKVEEDEPTKEEVLSGLREAVDEVKLIKAGKREGVSARDLLSEL
ncbi:MAG: hypothetical protein WKF91_12970 [Segetibacter sp.]